jgi:hypothetical protein
MTVIGRCPAQTGPVWKCGGEPCGCILPADHPKDQDHQCDCGAWWIDSVRRDITVRDFPHDGNSV